MNFAHGPRIFGDLFQNLPVWVRAKSCPRFVSRFFAGIGCQIAEIRGKGTDDRLPDKNGLDAAVEEDRDLAIIEHVDLQVAQAFVGTFINTEFENTVVVLKLILRDF